MLQNRDKIKANAVSVCERLGKYRQAFAWTAIYLMSVLNGGSSTERESDRDSLGSTSTTNSLGKISSNLLEIVSAPECSIVAHSVENSVIAGNKIFCLF